MRAWFLKKGNFCASSKLLEILVVCLVAYGLVSGGKNNLRHLKIRCPAVISIVEAEYEVLPL